MASIRFGHQPTTLPQAPSGKEIRIYEVGSRFLYAEIGAWNLLTGILLTVVNVLWSPGLTTINTKSWTSLTHFVFVFVFFLAGLHAIRLAWRNFTQLPYEVRVGEDGQIVFVKVLGSVRINVSEIKIIRKTVLRIQLGAGYPREIQIVHTQGSVPVKCFRRVENLIAHLRALQPGITVAGEWPGFVMELDVDEAEEQQAGRKTRFHKTGRVFKATRLATSMVPKISRRLRRKT